MSLNLVLMEDESGGQVPSYNENGEVLVQDITDESFHYVPLSDELIKLYPQLQVDEPMMYTVDSDIKQKAYWTYEATILLINKYKFYQPYFADSIHKNTEVWDNIAKEFRNEGYAFCGNQCESRWKYIRGKYLKKKDNCGPGSTGDEFYQFEYYKEMDDVLGKKPNVVPKYLASSNSSPILKTGTFASKSRSSDFNVGGLSNVNSLDATTRKRKATLGRITHKGLRPKSLNFGPNDTLSGRSSRSSQSSSDNVDLAETSESSIDMPHSLNSQSTMDNADLTAPSAATSSSGDTRGLNYFFDDRDGSGTPPLSPSQSPSRTCKTDDNNKGKHRKEPWDENVQRQEKYHQEMMQMQRDSLDVFKDIMSQMLDCFRRN